MEIRIKTKECCGKLCEHGVEDIDTEEAQEFNDDACGLCSCGNESGCCHDDNWADD